MNKLRAVCLPAALALGAEPAQTAGWQKALARPLSPGSVALLVEHPREPGVRERWAAALNAVVRWRYAPTLLDGRPVPVLMTVTVTFRLGP